MSNRSSKMRLVDTFTRNELGKVNYDEATLVCYCNIVNPPCETCKRCIECDDFHKKFDAYPILCDLKMLGE